MYIKLNYFLREGVRNVYSNGLMSIASVCVMVCCFILMGFSFLISRNIKNTLKNIEKDNSITVYLKADVSYDLEYMKNKLSSIDNISSCILQPKEEALKNYEDLLGDSLIDLFEGDNPLPDAFQISMEDLSKYQETVSLISSMTEVDSISDRGEVAKKLSNLKSLLKKLGIWIVVGLMSVSIMIISNTIRITMYNRRFEISIMKSIGATNMFIRLPFIVEGIILGSISSVISIFILKFAYERATEITSSLVPIAIFSFDRIFYQMLGAFVIFGIFLGIVSSLLSIKKYLNKEGGMSVVW